MPEESTQGVISRRLRHVVAPGGNDVPGVDRVSAAGAPPEPADAPPEPADAPPAPGRSGRLPGPNPFDPGRRGVRALALVAVFVVLVAAILTWRARPRPEQVAATDSAAAAAPAGPAAVGPAAGSDRPAGDLDSSASVGGEVLVVAVAGKVRHPGLVRLPAGARVADAVEAAGGLLPGADAAFLNLARKVADGELILVGVTAPPGAVGQVVDPAGGGGPAAGQPAGRVNLNTATLAQLDALPGVGPVLAQRIIDHRERRGPFRAVGDLRQVDGIGNARYEQLKDLVTV